MSLAKSGIGRRRMPLARGTAVPHRCGCGRRAQPATGVAGHARHGHARAGTRRLEEGLRPPDARSAAKVSGAPRRCGRGWTRPGPRCREGCDSLDQPAGSLPGTAQGAMSRVTLPPETTALDARDAAASRTTGQRPGIARNTSTVVDIRCKPIAQSTSMPARSATASTALRSVEFLASGPPMRAPLNTPVRRSPNSSSA